MQHKYLLISLLISCFQAAPSLGQDVVSDTTLLLREVIVEAPRISNFTPGLKTTRFDSLTKAPFRQENLSDLLAAESPMFVKSYGLGSLATTSFRGGSANHTAVLWNGISLNSPMNGQLDLSLVPLAASDEIRLQHGGTSALFGSGAVAGVIHLLNQPEFDQGITAGVNLSAGSFSDLRQRVFVEFSKKRFVSSLKVFNATVENDFKYNSIYSGEDQELRQTNAELENRGVISENKLLIGENQVLSLNAWLQHTDRNLPPTMIQNQGETNQVDDALRLTSEWKHEKNNVATYIRTAWLNEKLVFTDQLAEIAETSRTRQLIGEAETKITLGRAHTINVGFHNTYATASNRSFDENAQQNRFALFASYLIQPNEKLSFSLSGREELLDQELLPFTWSAGGQYTLADWLSLRAYVSRVYRIPTFNDLYWAPRGNPDLKPEDGYASEAGVHLKLENKTLHFEADVTGFNRNIQNWILWLPGTSYWSPQNIASVWSRGVETNSSLALQAGKVRITLDVLTNYILSTNQTAKFENDRSVDKQLIYSPMYSGMAKISIQYKKFALSYRHNYVGYRFTSTDNTQYLEPYHLGSAFVSYGVRLKKYKASLFLRANNIWNEQYQVIGNRAMPGINFNTGISIQFNHKSNT